MKRVRNAAMLAAMLAFSSPSQANHQSTSRTRASMNDVMLAPAAVHSQRGVDPEDAAFFQHFGFERAQKHLDRSRDTLRSHERALKARTREL